jgi:hypothetical protein
VTVSRLFPAVALVVSLLLTAGVPEGLAQQKDAEPALLSIDSVVVEPQKPGADTLCRLKVRIENRHQQVASQLGFSVKINGQELPVYRNQLFMFPLEPGKVGELSLFNFWTTETSRPMPSDGKLRVEVALLEAQWMEIKMVEEVETWTPLGEVAGLPASASVTVEMSR